MRGRAPEPPRPGQPKPRVLCAPGVFYPELLPALSLHLPDLLMDQNPQGKNLEWEWLTGRDEGRGMAPIFLHSVFQPWP